jgi:hypothetical protein
MTQTGTGNVLGARKSVHAHTCAKIFVVGTGRSAAMRCVGASG